MFVYCFRLYGHPAGTNEIASPLCSFGSNPTPHGLSPSQVGPGGVPPRLTLEGSFGWGSDPPPAQQIGSGWVYSSVPQVGPSSWPLWLAGSSSHHGGDGSQDA